MVPFPFGWTVGKQIRYAYANITSLCYFISLANYFLHTRCFLGSFLTLEFCDHYFLSTGLDKIMYLFIQGSISFCFQLNWYLTSHNTSLQLDASLWRHLESCRTSHFVTVTTWIFYSNIWVFDIFCRSLYFSQLSDSLIVVNASHRIKYYYVPLSVF